MSLDVCAESNEDGNEQQKDGGARELIGILCQCQQTHPERQPERQKDRRQIRLITLSPISVVGLC